MSTDPLLQPSDTVSSSRQCGGELARIFDELPKASIVSVSRPETAEISPILLSYTIELQYKQAR
ncbi:phospholipase D p1-like protein [Trifolium pratense]|uniref:Phospholipase D p1-like protein n=1 Tax=Trifolium pratense TaxID=57577 RepID=A0A2K3K1J8_TRIPR|nr:phospholipase D p1-like protein [Trifolium pratense]PNX85074.1 phospholipase D p1-like protein [Trifolium pratense]